MVQTPFPGELIGEEMEVIQSRNKSLLGIKGQIVDETRATLALAVSGTGGRKVLLKNAVTIKLLRTGKVIEGKNILRRPEERMK